MQRDLEQWQISHATRCGRSAPKYQITRVWKESPVRATLGAPLEFLLVIYGRLRKANKSSRHIRIFLPLQPRV
jgi:hypothetical protein